MSFHVGQKVECVDNSMEPGRSPWPGVTYPKLGTTYTVRDIVPNQRGGMPLLLLNEIRNPDLVTSGREGGFDALRFRPITESEYDISCFTKLLTPTDKVTA